MPFSIAADAGGPDAGEKSKKDCKTMRVLLVEDDMKIGLFVSNGLKEAGFEVDHVSNGKDGLQSALDASYDVAVIDLMLPVIDGLAVIEQMRANGVNTPVLILSARRAVDDRVKGLKTGGDDYLTKPFAFSELLARVQALIRRSAVAANSPLRLEVSDLVLDIQTRKVRRADHPIDLQPLEFSLLEYLMRHAGQVISKTTIMEDVWDYNFIPQTNVVEARICCLRDKIDRDFDRKLIHTVRGVGYVLKEGA